MNSKPASFFTMHNFPPPTFNLENAKSSLHNGYTDYVCGRVIKADIYSSYVINTWGYDRDNGDGAFEKVVNSLRKSMK